MASVQSLQQLADRVKDLTKSITLHLEATKQSEPTLEPDSTIVEEDSTFEWLRDEVNQAANELLLRVNGPVTFARNVQLGHFELVAWQAALEFDFFQHVPLDGEITLTSLATQVGIDEDRVARFLRTLNIQRVFKEVREDIFAHSASSVFIARNPAVRVALLMQLDDLYKAASSISDSIRLNPKEATSQTTPFTARFGAPIYQYYKTQPAKFARFAQAMEGSALLESRSLSQLRDSYPWQNLGSAKIVDVGGGEGQISLYLAQQFPNLEFIVQDIFEPQRSHDHEVEGRVSFAKQDFFKDQPTQDLGAIFIKHCLHNYVDDDCVKILRHLVPALESNKPGTPLLIIEGVLASVGEKNLTQERTLRHGDLCMLVTLAGKERSEKQFRALLKAADERLEIVKIHGTCTTKLIEVVLRRNA